MQKFKMIKTMACFLPTVCVLAAVALSLDNYSPKAFEPEVTEIKLTETRTEYQTADTTKNTTKNTSKNKSETTKNVSEETTKTVVVSQGDNIGKSSNVKYTDGDFYGEAAGFRGNVGVCVTIKDGKISLIKVVKSQDDAPYFNKAAVLLSRMADAQTTNVDVVSGATYSSNGIIGATRNALSKAEVSVDGSKKSPKITANKSSKKTGSKSNKSKKKNTTKGTIPYKDGVYYGTGEGYKGDVKVAVVIENKKIQYILVMENEDDEAYFTKARGVISSVIKYQRADVDTVSGATYSSKGILEAIKEALKNAKKATSGNKTETETTKKSTTENITTVYVPETGNGTYKDGVYALTVMCRPDEDEEFDEYTLTAKVTVKNDWVVEISDIEGTGDGYDQANDWYIKRAINGTSKKDGIVKQILVKGNAQSVDTVSGATCSSKALIELVNKALNDAKNQ